MRTEETGAGRMCGSPRTWALNGAGKTDQFSLTSIFIHKRNFAFCARRTCVLIHAPQATVAYLRVWSSVHFGYYFYAHCSGDFLFVKNFGELNGEEENRRSDLDGNRTRVKPLLNATPPTLLLCPPRQNRRVNFRTQSAPTHVGCLFVRWSDRSDSGSMGYVG